jgi:hypothetical protein
MIQTAIDPTKPLGRRTISPRPVTRLARAHRGRRHLSGSPAGIMRGVEGHA